MTLSFSAAVSGDHKIGTVSRWIKHNEMCGELRRWAGEVSDDLDTELLLLTSFPYLLSVLYELVLWRIVTPAINVL